MPTSAIIWLPFRILIQGPDWVYLLKELVSSWIKELSPLLFLFWVFEWCWEPLLPWQQEMRKTEPEIVGWKGPCGESSLWGTRESLSWRWMGSWSFASSFFSSLTCLLADLKCMFYNHKEFDLSHTWMVWWFSLLLLLLSHFSHVRLCVTPQTAAYQAAPSMGFSRQEYWSGVPLPSLSVL